MIDDPDSSLAANVLDFHLVDEQINKVLKEKFTPRGCPTMDEQQIVGLGEGSPSSLTSGDGVGFLMEIVQLIAQTKGERGQVYEFFRVNRPLA